MRQNHREPRRHVRAEPDANEADVTTN